jgi:hypothetical protein
MYIPQFKALASGQNEYITFSVEKYAPKFGLHKMRKENNRLIGQNTPNLVTLLLFMASCNLKTESSV